MTNDPRMSEETHKIQLAIHALSSKIDAINERHDAIAGRWVAVETKVSELDTCKTE